ncbi:MAG: histidinol-phosphate transaminase [Flavobacterium sp.]|nr:histidinol-phosphate transaminase [Candidatus Neoflavobacterium equi]
MDLQKIIRPNIWKMAPYSSARDEFKDAVGDFVFLDANENPFDNSLNRYPDPMQTQLKVVLSKLKGVETNQILVGNGSDEVLDLLFRAVCEPNVDNVLTIAPSYGMYSVLANLNAVENRLQLLDADFQPKVEEILSKVDARTKMIFLCSPNNPTGNDIIPEKIVQLLENFDGFVVIDEAYIEFSNQNSWIEVLNDYPNLVVTQTLSKAVGLAGLRVGLLYANKDFVGILNKIKPPYNVNVLSQAKAVEILKDYDKVAAATALIVEEKKKMNEALKEISFIQKIYPSAANFILIEVDDANSRYEQVLAAGFVLRNRTKDPLCKNCLRISVGTPSENEALLNLLKTL